MFDPIFIGVNVEVHAVSIHGLKHFFGRSGVALRDVELLERFRPWDWPILSEWSAGGSSTRLSSPVARRVPRSSTSAQPVAPSPRIHEMDRKCARALPRVAE
jgi:hypothetical protein